MGSMTTSSPWATAPPETEAVIVCPYCGEPNEIALDAGSGSVQEYEEDCQVCCRPGGNGVV